MSLSTSSVYQQNESVSAIVRSNNTDIRIWPLSDSTARICQKKYRGGAETMNHSRIFENSGNSGHYDEIIRNKCVKRVPDVTEINLQKKNFSNPIIFQRCRLFFPNTCRPSAEQAVIATEPHWSELEHFWKNDTTNSNKCRIVKILMLFIGLWHIRNSFKVLITSVFVGLTLPVTVLAKYLTFGTDISKWAFQPQHVTLE